MKVILLQDVAKIGKRSEIVVVPDGYALNQLIPKKMAEPATATNQKRIERLQAGAAEKAEANKENFTAAVAKLKEASLMITVEANEQGHLFKAVHEADVVAAAAAVGVQIDASVVQISEPIKAVGEHVVSLMFGDSVEQIAIAVTAK